MKVLIPTAAAFAAVLVASEASALPVTIDANGYATSYEVRGVGGARGSKTFNLAAGDHWIDVAWGSAFRFRVSADGSVTTESPAATASGATLTFRPVDLTVDYGDAIGSHSIVSGPPVDRATGLMRVLPGLPYAYAPAYSSAFGFSVNAAGNISTSFPAAEVDGRLMILHAVDVAVERDAVVGWHHLTYGPVVSSTGVLTVIPGLTYLYSVAYGAQFWLDIDDDGTVSTTLPAATGSLLRLDLEGTDIFVDTAGVKGWHLLNYGGRVDPATGMLRVVAGLDYMFSPAYGAFFTMKVDDFGNVTTTLPAAVGGPQRMTFVPRWLEVTSTNNDFWYIEYGPGGIRGSGAALFLPGLPYDFNGGGAITRISTSNDCAIAPARFTSRSATYDLACRARVIDADGDGTPDGEDTCPGFDDAADADADGTADGCDACPVDYYGDSDGDGSCDGADVCSLDPHDDADGDGLCADEEAPGCDRDADNDLDGDGVCAPTDTCPADPQNDVDVDGVCGDVDPCPNGVVDADADGTPDACDRCPLDVNNDSDGDGSCDSDDACPLDHPDDTDLDGVCDSADICPRDAEDDVDLDGACGDVDACPFDEENDVDGDGVCELSDNCDVVANAGQSDLDGDGLGDACEPDADDDGVIDDVDNCLSTANTDQADADADGEGDACDADDDDDGVNDAADTCPGTAEGLVVEPNGCSIAQTCPANVAWKNHGAYVSCVSRGADRLLAQGAISKAERDALVSAAAESAIGKR